MYSYTQDTCRKNRPLNVNITYNGHLLENSTLLSSRYVFPQCDEEAPQYLQVNDHIVRVTSDYLLWYDVTNITKRSGNWANVTTFNCTTDGRIKLITLVAAYNIPGSTDTVAYWVNMGHDVDNYYYKLYTQDNYIGRTVFESCIAGKIKEATATVVHAGSIDAQYTFNGKRLPGSQLKGSYTGLNRWNVTDRFNPTGENILTYDGVGQFYKIILALFWPY